LPIGICLACDSSGVQGFFEDFTELDKHIKTDA
jgi:hypothetical protein